MADPWHHAVSSSRKWGGTPEEYLPVHRWFDETKALLPDFRHRALRHHSEGIEMACTIFGQAIPIRFDVCPNCEGGILIKACHGPGEGFRIKMIPVRWISEQHVREDMGGRIPSAVDWLRAVNYEPWMNRPVRLSSKLEEEHAHH